MTRKSNDESNPNITSVSNQAVNVLDQARHLEKQISFRQGKNCKLAIKFKQDQISKLR